MFSFEVKGGREVGQKLIESVNLATHLANIGDAKTLIIHPASTTHAQLTEQQLVDAGVLPGVVRLSVGIEDVEDIIDDLDQALSGRDERPACPRSRRPMSTRSTPRPPPCDATTDAADPDDLETVRLVNGLSCELPANSPLAKLLKSQRTWIGPDAKQRLRILNAAKSVAIVGASPNPQRSSYFVGTYLQQSSDYRLYFVNPNATEILGQPAYASLADLPEVPDIVVVFRRGSDIPSVVDDVVAAGAKTIWVQLGIWNEEAAYYGEEQGSRSSWTAASRSSTPASTAACTCSASTPPENTARKGARSPRARGAGTRPPRRRPRGGGGKMGPRPRMSRAAVGLDAPAGGGDGGHGSVLSELLETGDERPAVDARVGEGAGQAEVGAQDAQERVGDGESLALRAAAVATGAVIGAAHRPRIDAASPRVAGRPQSLLGDRLDARRTERLFPLPSRSAASTPA